MGLALAFKELGQIAKENEACKEVLWTHFQGFRTRILGRTTPVTPKMKADFMAHSEAKSDIELGMVLYGAVQDLGGEALQTVVDAVMESRGIPTEDVRIDRANALKA